MEVVLLTALKDQLISQTIIETLKYATTGEQPPNSKGGAFIHDPKLCGEKEVLAQVKLSFRSTVGQKLVVTRSLQLTMKKTQRSMKTLDGSLVIYNNGERTGLSTKVGELDDLVPNYLGVSPAILDAVIFCHQDESLWPMSEPAALKKKFDEIFEAMKYTKAIDNLKVVRKKQGEELQKLKILESSSKDAKEKGQRAEKHLAGLQTQIEDLREQGEDLTRQMDEVQGLAKSRREEANSFFGIVQELKSKQDQYEVRNETVTELKDSIVKMRTESDEWLEEHLQQYEGSLARLQSEKEAKTAEHRKLQSELSTARSTLGAKQAEQGKHQSDKEKYERQLQTRVQMVREAAERHEVRGYESEDLKDSQVQTFLDRIQKVWQDKRRDLERLQRDNAKELEKDTAVITELETRKAARTQDRVSAKQRIAAIDRRMAALQRDMQNVDVDEGAQAILQSTYADVETRLRKTADEIQAAAADVKIEEENGRIWQLERENEKLTRELVDCTRRASDRAQLDLRKKELTERKRRLDTLTSTWQEKLAAVIGQQWTAESAEADYQQVMKQHVTTVGAARKKVETSQQELKQVEYRLSMMRERQKKTTAEAERCQKAVVSVLKAVKASGSGEDGAVSSEAASIDDYQEELDNTESEILTAEKDISLFDHLKDYYSKSQKVLNRFNKCSLCDRSFAEQPRERSKLLEKIAKNLDDKQKKELEEEKDMLEQSLGQLRAVRQQHDTYRRLESEQPGLRAETEAAESQRDTLVRRLEDEDAVLREAEERRAEVESMGKTIGSIAQAVREVTESERQIEKLTSQQQASGSGSGSSSSVEEIQELQARCGEQLRAAQTRLAKLSDERQRQRDVISGLELERSELKNRIAEAARQAERKADLGRQVQTLREETAQQREAMQQADVELEGLVPEMAKARTMRQDTLQRGQTKERQGAAERDAVAHTVSELRMLEKEMQDYVEGGGAERLAANGRAMAALEQTMRETEQAVETVAATVSRMSTEMDNSDREKKNIADNLSYRRNSRLLGELRGQILALEERRAADDYDRLVGEARRLEVQHSKLLAERSAIWGSMKTKDEELLRQLDEYEQEYRDAELRYREAHIRVETTKAAIEDLGRYAAALDKAIMEYHAFKMEEVNRIAGELWRATYQGTDIDTILIRSDNEAATGRRSYNYRVCMVKQDTEMDMRGRCSAGQKVLASIVIRLALAESFGVSCGLIALDEPTTNLDSDNIRSLAVSLHAIIRARQAQANFQLIVITHDEDFLRHMQCSDFCDTFYRVSRDDKQNSVIKRESITRLIEG
ncbi:DNA repair protein rad50 [Grosmannia clavigera kw1407]|uniref:DNA repair protein RAD50 n=1 Tax=Grosmannia clavigera (strain kw1407 / UAMH 11150) TaxID=655863 RepID=F0XU67_GROCL|nr:DNA repair protein rad50 [Grosmannia clavigera kw1407]EFW98801.1 DNA repair protein rad50 [Grosmannia clavigera kw1407]